MIVGICQFDLLLPEGHSLKDKRRILLRLKDGVRSRFKIQMAEVGFQDLWQRARLGFAVVGQDGRLLDSLVDQVLNFIDAQGLCSRHETLRETLSFP